MKPSMDSHFEGLPVHDQTPVTTSSIIDMTSHIDRLPPEILLDILRRVRNSSTKSELPKFAALQTVGCQWYDLVGSVLWIDIVLNNDTLPLFLSKEHAPDYAAIRSLTIRVRTIDPHIEELVRNGGIVDPGSFTDVPAGSFWENMRQLIDVLPKMARLKSFSLVFHDFPVVESGWFRSDETCRLLESLPKSCVAIEVDTNGLDGWVKPTHHICQTIRKILPRMKHVRLKLGSLCKCILLKDRQRAPWKAPCNSAKYTVAPLLETLIVSLGRLVRCQPPPLVPGQANQSPLQTSSEILNTIDKFSLAGAFPKATKISVFVWTDFGDLCKHQFLMPGLQNDHVSHRPVSEYDLIANQLTRMPYFGLPKFPGYDMIRYPVGEKSAKMVFGNKRALATLAEGRAWDTTVSGSRLPGWFAKSNDAWQRGYVFEDATMDRFDQGDEFRANTMHFRSNEAGEFFMSSKCKCEVLKFWLAVQVWKRNTWKHELIPIDA